MYFFILVVGTITKGAALLHEEGAREVYACCTHAVFRYNICLWHLFCFFDFFRCKKKLGLIVNLLLHGIVNYSYSYVMLWLYLQYLFIFHELDNFNYIGVDAKCYFLVSSKYPLITLLPCLSVLTQCRIGRFLISIDK